jgi:hypothetical protein
LLIPARINAGEPSPTPRGHHDNSVLLAAVVSGHSLVAALTTGVVVAAAALTGLMRYQNSAWIRAPRRRRFPARTQGHPEPA